MKWRTASEPSVQVPETLFAEDLLLELVLFPAFLDGRQAGLHLPEGLDHFLKTLADEENTDTKLIIIGINRCGESLVAFARDLNNRIDTIRLEGISNRKEVVVLIKWKDLPDAKCA